MALSPEEKKKADLGKSSILIAVVIVVIACWGVWSWASRTVDSFTAATSSTPAPDTSLSVVSSKPEMDNGGIVIAGVVKNSSTKLYRTVFVQFNLYDKSGTQIGDAIASVSNLEPLGSWKFKAPILQTAGLDHFTLQSVSGF